jgi:hypothetical protein
LSDRHAVGLATVNRDTAWPSVTGESLTQEAPGGWKIALRAEVELYRITVAVNGTVEIHPRSFDPDIGLIQMALVHRAEVRLDL